MPADGSQPQDMVGAHVSAAGDSFLVSPKGAPCDFVRPSVPERRASLGLCAGSKQALCCTFLGILLGEIDLRFYVAELDVWEGYLIFWTRLQPTIGV